MISLRKAVSNMYYYQHHIGDYRRDTAHLTLLEHGIYRQLLDLYYISEKPLDANAMRLICARSADELQSVKQILSEFFTLEDGKYYHNRCEDEISKFHKKSDMAKASAKVRWNKNKDLQDANAMQTQCEGNANHKPITNNHKPIKYTPPIPAELLAEWLAVRKKKPVTERVFNAIEKQARLLGWSAEQAIIKCCEQGWIGFDASWVDKPKSKSHQDERASVSNAAFGNLLNKYSIEEKEITSD